jgi:hypothetical protein
MMPSDSPDCFSNLIRTGWIGSVGCEGREYLRRIFVTVRDRSWVEVPLVQWHATQNLDARVATFAARHTSELVDFEWQGEFCLSADAKELRFRCEGRALRDMEICRLGLVILHPVESMVGAEITARGPQGEEQFNVSRTIHPQPIVQGLPSAMTAPFSELEIDQSDFGWLRLKFGGELFELEDQRNWGDASFKTYCTPLKLGFPRGIGRGTTIRHTVEASFTPASVRSRRARRSALAKSDKHAPGVWVGEDAMAASPKEAPMLGIVLPDAGAATLTRHAIMPWDHIQIRLDKVTPAMLEECCSVLPTATMLELVVKVEEGVDGSADLFASLKEHSSKISRILLTHKTYPLPSKREVAEGRDMLQKQLRCQRPIFLLPNGYFVELNRGRPLEFDIDGIAFPLSPTVHATDRESVLGNIEAVGDMVNSARGLASVSRIAIAPLAAYFPHRECGYFDNELWKPWLTKTIARLSAAGVTSITLGSDLE